MIRRNLRQQRKYTESEVVKIEKNNFENLSQIKNQNENEKNNKSRKSEFPRNKIWLKLKSGSVFVRNCNMQIIM